MQNLQKKVYHKNRFKPHPKTQRIEARGTKFEEVFNIFNSNLKISESYVELDNLVIFVEKGDIRTALKTAKDCGFEMLSDMSAIHLEDDSFCVFYQLLSMRRHLRIRIKTHTKKEVDSISDIYRNAIWSERETFDMLGVDFIGHSNLKRLIMPDDWVGHPLRKDYPLQGDEHAQWYEVDKIFGKEYREKIGAEQRDSSFVDSKDTFNFAHMGFEVARGAPPSEEPTEIRYQEKGGVFVVTKFDKAPKELKKRR